MRIRSVMIILASCIGCTSIASAQYTIRAADSPFVNHSYAARVNYQNQSRAVDPYRGRYDIQAPPYYDSPRFDVGTAYPVRPIDYRQVVNRPICAQRYPNRHASSRPPYVSSTLTPVSTLAAASHWDSRDPYAANLESSSRYYVGSGLLGQPTVYGKGQPIRNILRALMP